jgi:hypothetical protein
VALKILKLQNEICPEQWPEKLPLQKTGDIQGCSLKTVRRHVFNNYNLK